MKMTKLAVFGHYDSRGGTTGMPIADFTVEEVEKAAAKYDTDCFGFDAKEWGTSDGPSREDFLFVAELYHADDITMDTPRDLCTEITDVLIGAGQFEPVRAFEQNWRMMVSESCEAPVQLELVTFAAVPDDAPDVEVDDEDDDTSARAEAARSASVFLAHPQTRRWEDDAFGFMIGTGI